MTISDIVKLPQGFEGLCDKYHQLLRGVFYPKTDLQFEETELVERRQAAAHLSQQLLHTIQKASADLVPEEVSTTTLLPDQGTFHALYRLTTTRGESRILRVDLLQMFDRGFGLIKDALAAASVRRFEVPMVITEIVDLSRKIFNYDYAIAHQATGQSLRSLEDPETQALNPKLLYELGTVLAKVHQCPTSGFGLLAVPDRLDNDAPVIKGVHTSWLDYLHLNLEQHLGVCFEIGAVSAPEKQAIEDWFKRSGSELAGAPSRLLHGDPGHHNVFAEDTRITALIDWEDALCGDPVFDLAFCGTFCRDEMREPLLDGYQSVQSVPEDFERRYWLYYLRIAISKTVHRHRFGIRDRPDRPPASRRIQKALNHLDGGG